jgi:hypothetical protein
MSKHTSRFLFMLAIGGLTLLPGTVLAADYYVNNFSGNDANNCLSTGTSCATITRALILANTKSEASTITVENTGTNYDTTTETFPLNVAVNYPLQLKGNGQPILEFDNNPSSETTIMNILGSGSAQVEVSGFTFKQTYSSTPALFGITLLSGATITDCTFDSSLEIGIELFKDYTSSFLTTNFTLTPLTITNNKLYSTYGTQIDLRLGFDTTQTGLSADIGAITITGNTFDGSVSSSATTAVHFPYLAISGLTGGSVTVGDINISDNTITSYSDGIYFSKFMIMDIAEQTTVTFGNVTIDRNTLEESALYFSGFIGDKLNDKYIFNSTVTTGTLSVSDNKLSVDGGMDIYPFEVWGLVNKDENADFDPAHPSSATIGKVVIKGNEIDHTGTNSSSGGLWVRFLYHAEEIVDDSQVTFAPVEISDNTLKNVSDKGLRIEPGPVTKIGDTSHLDRDGDPVVTTGTVTVSGNTLTTSSGPGIVFMANEMGTYLQGAATVDIGRWTIDNNTFTDTTATAGTGLVLTSSWVNGTNEYQTAESSLTVQGAAVTNNTITAGAGIIVGFLEPGSRLEKSASWNLGSVEISGNTVTADRDGIRIFFSDIANDVRQDAIATMAPWTIKDNSLDIKEAVQTTGGLIDIQFQDKKSDPAGDNLTSSKTVTLPDWIITGNTGTIEQSDGISITMATADDTSLTGNLDLGTITLSGNSLTGKNGATDGMTLNVDTLATNATVGTPELTGNTVSGFAGNAISFKGLWSGAKLTCNTMENNSGNGLYLETDGSGFSGINNAITGNGKGLVIVGTATANMENNWWGDQAGPEACTSCNKIDAGSGSVDFDPWLRKTPLTPCSDQPARFPWPMFQAAITGSGDK